MIEHIEIRKLVRKKIRQDLLDFEERIIKECLESRGLLKETKHFTRYVKKSYITKILTSEGSLTSDRNEIINEITKFYESLYMEEESDFHPISIDYAGHDCDYDTESI